MNAATHTNAELWEPRRSLTLSMARRHTDFIKVIRKLLLLASALILLVLGYFIVEGPERIEVITDENESVRMTNPRYAGVDGDGEPYKLTADYAVRSRDDINAIKLENPVMTFKRLRGAESSRVTADKGLYNSTIQDMELRENVKITTDDGYICDTSHARILVAEKIVRGSEPITCQGGFGNVRGDRYIILDNYSRYIFTGNVSGLIIPQ